jgi:anti-sigma factor RsiW
MQNLIHAYLDGELDLVRNLEIEHHLHDCSICSRVYENQKALQTAIRQTAPYFKAPPDLRNRVRSSLRKRHSPAVPSPTRGGRLLSYRGLLGIAASVTLAVILTWAFVRLLSSPTRRELVVQDVISSHVRSLMVPSHIIDVASSDQHKVKPWFKGKLDFSPPVKDLSDHGFPLVGGRLDYVNNRPVAALVYERRQHSINLFIWPSESGSVVQPRTLSRQGFQLVHWSQGGLTFWAISDLNAQELEEFVQLVSN